ncbi:hypothetical protein RND71_022431 [Anisodus tanguticus]|uniref:Uncharacterized protein n=1 Tax=Anisodus tanguticus TaxID=243964 RepID=A0AAE1RS18_9SOLA|nr:hypothetical protein RND71_022431 [Anisodus tanguticus]
MMLPIFELASSIEELKRLTTLQLLNFTGRIHLSFEMLSPTATYQNEAPQNDAMEEPPKSVPVKPHNAQLIKIESQPSINDLMDDMFKEGDDEFKNLRKLINNNFTKILQAIKGNNDFEKCIMSDVGINKENSNGDTLKALTEEIQEGGDPRGELIESEGFGSHIQIETFQNTSLDSDILSHEETHMPIDENFVIAPSDVGLSFVADVGAIAVSDKVEQFDVLQTS